MCGIVAAVAQTDVVAVLVQGLMRLEYRGYDSCGIAINTNGLQRSRSVARVSDLQAQIEHGHLRSTTGIAHTRWATHGAPQAANAHPHFSYGPGSMQGRAPRVALVHNGIIENYEALRQSLKGQGYVFDSQTDSEVIAHLIDSFYAGDLLAAVQAALPLLQGAFAIAVLHQNEAQRIVGARLGSPLVLGLGANANFLASDAMALAGITDQIVYLEEGDIVDIQTDCYWIGNTDGIVQERAVKTVQAHSNAVDLGPYQHYMQKEIFEQPQALANTLEGVECIAPELFGENAKAVFERIDAVLILACGTSYYSGMVAKYWLEAIAQIPTSVEIASEYRYRKPIVNPRCLVLGISQSGETADTLAALQYATNLGMQYSLAVCNVATSAMVRACHLHYITRAGIEVGVASSKAFTTQLAALFLLTLSLAKIRRLLDESTEKKHLLAMRHLPVALQAVLALEPQLMAWAAAFAQKEHALFLGRGIHYPIALEGALKLKEISYIHAEAYPAGELKHGPLALVTDAMPVVVVAPKDALLEKLKNNMQEVRARGGMLYVLTDAGSNIHSAPGIQCIRLPEHYGQLSPVLHVVPLQLLAYHTALVRGTDVDKPRNLAKSVTVE